MGEYSSTRSHALLHTAEAYPANSLARRRVLIILKTLYRSKYRICNYIAGGLRYTAAREPMPKQDGVFRRRTPLQLLKRIQCRRSLTKFAIKLNVGG